MNSGHLIDIAPDSHIPVKLYWHRWNHASKLLDNFLKTIVKNSVIC
ncbi:MAG: hypothetical protein KAJ62_03395 [Desulfobacteraceae bacterium]|nr:hypothetical protein [Desulfobacteraceae bacterium]